MLIRIIKRKLAVAAFRIVVFLYDTVSAKMIEERITMKGSLFIFLFVLLFI